ncbi:DUF4837 domain-containing protein [Flagellimonas aquimarina]|jgi:hypothetical protein|uniref:DUF4837 domain-containing protein n=1 Tax=Flagellimonas aquimarina TaxID=2201895 RepID=A0A316L4K7_9FLAO|nr:DUF4837 family protein [Allomuricauda koreensis]PWL39859.1 DUF4837 domain-containing protein [Allomuricauda koreensis]
MKKLIILSITTSFLVMLSCKDSGPKQRFLPPSTGGINSLMVVMDTELWQGGVGDRIREQFAAPVLGLPQGEPKFSITQIPPQVFKGAITYSRSVLFVEQDTLSLGHIKTDVYAKPQKIAVVKGETYNDLVGNIDSLAGIAISSFKKVEISEAQKRFTRSLNKEKAFEEEFGISLKVPSLYKVGKREKNFVWMDIQIPKGTMNIVAYTMPWNSFSNDSTFVNDIVKMRDSIGKKYVPGPYENTFMVTEKAFSPYIFPAQIGGKKAAEARGIWEISGYPMAGPFLTYIINDKENNRKLVLEGFTFAPSAEKRDYMFELEAILRTVKFNSGS